MISVLENILEGSQHWKSVVMLEQLPSKYGVQNVARKGWKQRFCRNNMYLICGLTTWGLNKAMDVILCHSYVGFCQYGGSYNAAVTK